MLSVNNDELKRVGRVLADLVDNFRTRSQDILAETMNAASDEADVPSLTVNLPLW